MARPYEAAIFDLDGTLLDTEQIYSVASNAFLARYGARFEVSLKRRTMGRDNREGAAIVIEALGLELGVDAYLEGRDREFRRLLPQVEALPGAEIMVARARAAGLGVAIATSSHATLARAKIETQAFLTEIDVVICGDDPRLARGKPDPAIFELAAASLGVDPGRCVAFEDSANGVQAALAAGMDVVGIRDPRWALPRSVYAGAQVVVDDLSDLDPARLGW